MLGPFLPQKGEPAWSEALRMGIFEPQVLSLIFLPFLYVCKATRVEFLPLVERAQRDTAFYMCDPFPRWGKFSPIL